MLEEPSWDPRTYAALVFYGLLSALALKAIIKSANYCGGSPAATAASVRGLPREPARAYGGMKKFNLHKSSSPLAV